MLDAGCGPGQWTGFLSGCGAEARGVDLVPEFVEQARANNPSLSFEVGSFERLGAGSSELGGVLAWYSLIHHKPEEIAVPLAEFARVLRPGGSLLLGFFEGPALEAFDHAVTSAYRWPVAKLSERVAAAGFEVVETHARTAIGQRPHGALAAHRVDSTIAKL